MSGEVVVYLPNDSRFKLAVCAKDFGGDEVALRQAAEANGWQGFVTATEYEALQAKLDAVTKDGLALQGRAQRAESLLRECLEPLVWASNEAYGEFNDFERADKYEEIRQRIDAAITDQGRAGEGE